MAPIIESFASATASGTPTSLTITKPTGTVSGNLLVAIFEWYVGNLGSLPSGWTTIDTHNEGVTSWGDGGLATAYKIAGGSEPANYTFTVGTNGFSLASGAQGTMMRISGHDAVTPINAHTIGAIDSSSPFTTPSVTTTVVDTLVLHGWGAQNPAGGVSWNTPDRVTFVDKQGSGNNTMLMVARENKALAGATTTRDATASSAYATWATQIAIAPTASSPTGPVYIDVESNTNSATNAHIGNYAGTLTVGDVLVAIIIADNVNVGFDLLKPAGWVFKGDARYGDLGNVSTSWRTHVLAKKLTSASTHSWTFTSNFGLVGSGPLGTRVLIHRFTGADLPEAFTILGGRDNALVLSSLTSGGSDRLLAAWAMGDDGTLNFSAPSGMTEIYDVHYSSPGTQIAMDNEARSSGATGTRTMQSPTAPFGGTRTLGTMLLLPFADVTGPTVAITSPADGATVSGTVGVTATASDPSGVDRVELYIDGVLHSTDSSNPYSFSWNTTLYDEDFREVSVTAYDLAGNSSNTSITVYVDNTATSIAITDPDDGSIVDTTVTIEATVTGGGTASVQFLIDGVEIGDPVTSLTNIYTKTIDVRDYLNGEYTVTARVISL